MIYSKPEIVVLGTAVSSIQGNKIVFFEPTSSVIANRPVDCELDD
jgi:hypothetical protein